MRWPLASTTATSSISVTKLYSRSVKLLSERLSKSRQAHSKDPLSIRLGCCLAIFDKTRKVSLRLSVLSSGHWLFISFSALPVNWNWFAFFPINDVFSMQFLGLKLEQVVNAPPINSKVCSVWFADIFAEKAVITSVKAAKKPHLGLFARCSRKFSIMLYSCKKW